MVRFPYLIQRGTINKPMVDRLSFLSQAVQLDYMGSAEFEFGALPRSLRAIESKRDMLTLRKVPSIMDGESCLRVVSTLTDEEFVEYEKILVALREGRNIRTKECTRFNVNHMPFSSLKCDFWWDINNHVMFTFDKNFSKRIISHIDASLEYMNAQA